MYSARQVQLYLVVKNPPLHSIYVSPKIFVSLVPDIQRPLVRRTELEDIVHQLSNRKERPLGGTEKPIGRPGAGGVTLGSFGQN